MRVDSPRLSNQLASGAPSAPRVVPLTGESNNRVKYPVAFTTDTAYYSRVH